MKFTKYEIEFLDDIFHIILSIIGCVVYGCSLTGVFSELGTVWGTIIAYGYFWCLILLIVNLDVFIVDLWFLMDWE